MMEHGWNPVISHRERKRTRDDELREARLRAEAPHRPHRTRDLAWFDATHPPPTGTADEYDRNHAQHFGAEEGMVNGHHRRGIPRFPNDSDRDLAHAGYSESTQHRNRAQKSYNDAKKAHVVDNKALNAEEKEYYKHTTDGLLPTQHAELSGRALDLSDAARKNGSLRTDVEDKFPFGHHSLPQAIEHHRHARIAFVQHRRATNDHTRHEKHGSSEVDDGKRDCYHRRVTAGTSPHNRSREHELPPPGRYSAFPTTPPEERSNAADYGFTPPHSQSKVSHGHGADNSRPKNPPRTNW